MFLLIMQQAHIVKDKTGLQDKNLSLTYANHVVFKKLAQKTQGCTMREDLILHITAVDTY